MSFVAAASSLTGPCAERQARILEKQKAFGSLFPLNDNGLIVREIGALDLKAFQEIAAYPGFSYYCFDGKCHLTQAFVRDALRSRNTPFHELRRSYMLAVQEASESKPLVGHVSIDLLDKKPDFFDLAYFTHPAYQGRGIATHASVALLRPLFRVMEVEEVVATVRPDNYGSKSVLAKLGFVETGETTFVESADGDSFRLCLSLSRDTFASKHGLVCVPT